MRKPHDVLTLLTTLAVALAFTVPLFASETDDRIEMSARESFVFKTYLQDDDISLQSKDGMVTLTGTVSDASHRSLAGDTVAGLPGVTGVDNQLIESGQTPEEKSDAWLITKVKATLLLHSNVNGTATEVSAENGIVTLRGQAESNAQKDLTAEYARGCGRSQGRCQ
jgi:hyperosmotically inducible periplasmic protein